LAEEKTEDVKPEAEISHASDVEEAEVDSKEKDYSDTEDLLAQAAIDLTDSEADELPKVEDLAEVKAPKFLDFSDAEDL